MKKIAKFVTTVNQKNRHMYRYDRISNVLSILNATMNNMRLAKFFYVRSYKIFAKYRRIANFNYCCPFLTAVIKMLKSYSYYFWQRIRRSMEIYWKIGWFWYGSPTRGAANLCYSSSFSARNGVVKFWSFCCKFDRSLNKNRPSENSDFWNRRRASDVVFKLIKNSAYVDALRR